MQEKYRNFPPLTHTLLHIMNKTQTKINHTTNQHNTPLPYTSPYKKTYKIRNQHFCEEVCEYVKYPFCCLSSFYKKDLFLPYTLPDNPFLRTEQVRGHYYQGHGE